jgi:3-hydroxyacyl-CoA dehydrogenase
VEKIKHKGVIMKLDEMLQDVTVIGAAGKMGSGIAALLAHEMALLRIKNPQTFFKLNLIDINEESFAGLRNYIKSQLVKMAERSIQNLRNLYSDRQDLVENWEIIDEFVNEGLNTLRFGSEPILAQSSSIIFEAIIENEELKVKVLKGLKELCREDVMFFTNTSSIPIGFLDTEVGLNGKIVGYHFYNPPIVQKLLEVITSDKTDDRVRNVAMELGKRIRKRLIPANDIAGFIGNGHYIRDGLHALSEVTNLEGEHTLPGAIYMINRISQDFLIRPMGIFQLIDYVGVDVFQSILRVMKRHLQDDTLESPLINQMMENGVKGGQRADGSQKDGFFQYEKNKLVGVYDIKAKTYTKLEEIQKKMDDLIGSPPEGFKPWKKMLGDKDKAASLESYFDNLKKASGLGAELARAYMKRSKAIGEGLVRDKVAHSDEDVNEVLMNGFFWLYGPINNYI